MGSLPSPPTSPAADASRIFASFCTRGTPTWLEFYDPSDNNWHRIGPIPGIAGDQSLKGFSMVSLGDSVYIIGGRLCRKSLEAVDDDDEDSDVAEEVDLAVRSDVVRYSVTDDEWAVCAPMTAPRFDFACAACDGRVYVAGGRCALSRGRGTSTGEVYDPARDRWDPLPSMGLARYKCAGVAWRGRFHVVGGFAEREEAGGMTMQSAVERCSAEVYNAEAGEWELVAGMWQLDVPPNQIVAVEGRRLFSSGDCLNTWKGHIEAYDGKLNIWNIVDWSHMHDLSSLLLAPPDSSSLSSLDGSPRSLQRKYVTMAPIGTRLFFLAGYRLPGLASRYLSVAHMFDTTATTDEAAWRSLEAVLVEEDRQLCAHCCVVQI